MMKSKRKYSNKDLLRIKMFVDNLLDSIINDNIDEEVETINDVNKKIDGDKNDKPNIETTIIDNNEQFPIIEVESKKSLYSHKNKRIGKNHKDYKPTISIKCNNPKCDNVFYVNRYYLKKYNRLFCCDKCRKYVYSLKPKLIKQQKICKNKTCNNIFYTYDDREYCCNDCEVK